MVRQEVVILTVETTPPYDLSFVVNVRRSTQYPSAIRGQEVIQVNHANTLVPQKCPAVPGKFDTGQPPNLDC